MLLWHHKQALLIRSKQHKDMSRLTRLSSSVSGIIISLIVVGGKQSCKNVLFMESCGKEVEEKGAKIIQSLEYLNLIKKLSEFLQTWLSGTNNKSRRHENKTS